MDVRDLLTNLADAQRQIAQLEKEIGTLRMLTNQHRRVLQTLSRQSQEGHTLFDLSAEYAWLAVNHPEEV